MRRTVSIIPAIVMVLTTALLCSGVIGAPAGADSLQDQINAKQSKVNDLEEKIAKLEKEGKELLSQIQLIVEQTEEIEEQIDLTNDRIKELGKAIDEQSKTSPERRRISPSAPRRWRSVSARYTWAAAIPTSICCLRARTSVRSSIRSIRSNAVASLVSWISPSLCSSQDLVEISIL